METEKFRLVLRAEWFCKTGWINDGTGRYHFDENGKPQTGWYQENQIWYFLNTVHDGYYGRALSNQWAWIDGYSYSFDADGKMYANCITPDGYEVNADGRWTVNGVVQFIEGKGIITTATTPGSGKVSGGNNKRRRVVPAAVAVVEEAIAVAEVVPRRKFQWRK